MRFVMLCMVALAGCASGGGVGNNVGPDGVYQPPQSVKDEYTRKMAELKAQRPDLFPAPRLQPAAETMDPAEAQKKAREDELLERALTGSPDYQSAVRRAATANIDSDASRIARGSRQTRASASNREALIQQEEQRLSDAVELRRRSRLAETQQQQRAAMNQQAAYACEARGQQIDAAFYNPRSILNLDGMVAGVRARDACLEAYQRTGIMP